MKEPLKTADTPKTPKARLPVAATPPSNDIGSTPRTPAFSPQVLKQIKTDIYEKEIRPYAEAANENKRKFSEISRDSEEKIQSATSSERYKDDKNAWKGFISGESSKKLSAYIEAQEATLQSVNHHIKVLVEQFAAGNLNLSSLEKDKEIERLEKFASHIQGNLIVLKEQTDQIIGEWGDEMRGLRRQEQSDWAYIDLLISRYKTPEGARLSLFKRRDPDTQERFRAKVFKAYDGAQKDEKLLWCCISGAWHTGGRGAGRVRAAHIVPYNIGELNANYLFGPPSDGAEHLMSPRNGLPMKAAYEEFMDEGSLVLVPAENSNDIRVVVFEPTPEPDLAEINGKILTFRNDFRPAKRYLCFAFVMTLLRRQRHNVPGWWHNSMEQGMKQVWASPGEYLRQSTLMSMARRIAHMSSKEASTFLNMSGNHGHGHAHPRLAPQSDDRDRLCTDSVSVSLASKGAGTVDPLESDDDGQDEDDSLSVNKSKGKGKALSGVTNKFAALMGDHDDEEEEA
jgi:hypothetical protein